MNRHPLFVSAVLPHHILPPLFNRYEGGGHYGSMTIIKLRQQLGDTQEVVALTGHYHNLLRQWAEV